jgi:hypothetical protein
LSIDLLDICSLIGFLVLPHRINGVCCRSLEVEQTACSSGTPPPRLLNEPPAAGGPA